MKKSKTLITLSVLVASSALLLTGCAPQLDEKGISVNAIPLSEDVVVSDFPNWSPAAAKVLTNAGWDVGEAQPNPGQSKENWPIYYTAVNKDNSCIFNISLDAQYLTLTGNDEEYETRDYLMFITKPQEMKLSEETTQNINVNDKSQSLSLMKYEYTYPNKIYTSDIVIDPNNPTPPAAVEPTIDGDVRGVIAARVLNSENDNPFFIPNPQMDKVVAEGGKLPPDYVNKTARPVILMKYECVNKDIDMKLWDKVLKEATIDMNITSIVKPEEE